MATLPETIQAVSEVPASVEETVYVKIPAVDLYDNTHPTVQLNSHKFEPGLTYKVSAAVGAEIEDRLSRFNKEQVRLLRPRTDATSLQQVNKGSQWGRVAPSSSADGAFASVTPADRVITVAW